MCGIFGAVAIRDERISPEFLTQVVDRLLVLSETRGNEAAGLLVHDGETIDLVKSAGEVKEFRHSAVYRQLVEQAHQAYRRVLAGEQAVGVALMGHSRMVTNGGQSDNDNNQPVIVDGAVGIHNGIIVNDDELWRRHPELQRRFVVDTEALLAVTRKHLDQTRDPGRALQRTFGEIYGSASTAIFFDDRPVLALGTNTGSLFWALNQRKTVLVFASERYILKQLLESPGLAETAGMDGIEQVKAWTGLVIDLRDLSLERVVLAAHRASGANGRPAAAAAPAVRALPAAAPAAVGTVTSLSVEGVGAAVSYPPWQAGAPYATGGATGAAARGAGRASAPAAGGNGSSAAAERSSPGRARIVDRSRSRRDFRRCRNCILPESYPFMDFDEKGICRYCRNWRRIEVKGKEALLRAVEPYRSKDGSPDVIVAFSGGRDSSYGLHYVKKELGMNPVAFTFDWGMVTDLARRNQARVCGKLGVEHILRSADLTRKRRYVRKNVEAWLKRPEVGMVTLFTAGDKEFYHYARQIRKETGIKLVVFCTGNMIEDTPYKTGLCGIREDDHGMTLTGLSFRNEMALLWYYIKNYAKNPGYLNESVWDTLKAYYYTFVVKDDFLYLFHYLPWTEQEIVGTIRREYDWEVATDTTSTWRIGDGTAAFYNYIYDTISGFAEDEVMLSNMIREGHLSRDQALARAEEYRAPRLPSIREYAQLVGFNCEEALRVINAAPKMY